MGCDIHLYIEYRSDVENREYWRGFGGRINSGRDYLLFAKIAGVRNNYNENYIEPRGLPEIVSYETKYDNLLFVDESVGPLCESCCEKEDAVRWVEEGISVWYDENFVTHPDWHSHSWLTPDELEVIFEEIKNDYEPPNNQIYPEWIVVLTILQKFTELGYQSRIVFWFDN